MAGLENEDIRGLIELDPDKFDRPTWVALAWARDWTIFNGQTPDPELNAEFEQIYSEQQRRDLLAVITVMSYANKVNNTASRKRLDLEDVGR